MNAMFIQSLRPDEISHVYKTHLKRDFPSNELKPLFVIKNHLRHHFYQVFGLFSGDEPAAGKRPDLGGLLAYACFFGSSRPESLLLLDYFAVVPAARQQGLGSRFLEQLQEHLTTIKGIAAEVESIGATADEVERTQRQRRLAFYQKAGFRHTAVQGHIFSVDYDLVYRPVQSDLEDIALFDSLQTLYREMLPKAMFDLNIHLHLVKDQG